MLTRHLRELEADGIVARTVTPTVPPRVDYALTALGDSLAPVLQAMRSWGAEYQRLRVAARDATPAPAAGVP